MKTILFLFSATILISLKCFGGEANIATNQLGGIENAAIIAKPVSVKAWRTAGSLKPGSSSPAAFYQKSGRAKLVSTNFGPQLSKVLLNKQSYPRSDGSIGYVKKNCAPQPGVVVNFSNGKQSVDVYFCFECAILIVKTDKDEKGTPAGLQSDFDPSRAELLRIVKKIFPKDPQIQALKASE